MNSHKTNIRSIRLVAGIVLMGWFIGCQESTVTRSDENPVLSEIQRMKRMVGEGHNYVVDQLVKNSENGLDLDVLKFETERFFKTKNMDVDLPTEILTEIGKFVGPDGKPRASFQRLAQTQTAVGMLDSMLSTTDAEVSEEWQFHFRNLAERMDAGEEFDSYIESAQVEDTSLITHMWFADGIYDSSEAYWSSTLGKMGSSETTALIPAWIVLDVGLGALVTAGNCALNPSGCQSLLDIALRFIVFGATASVGGSLTRVLFP